MLYSILRLYEAVNGDEINFFNPSELTSMCQEGGRVALPRGGTESHLTVYSDINPTNPIYFGTSH